MSFGHQGICSNFAAGRPCRFGRNCRYLHFRFPAVPPQFYALGNNEGINYTQPLPFPPRVFHSYSNQPTAGQQDNVVNYRTKPCRFFATNGRCRNGDQCNFLHEVNSAELPCKYYQRGKCQFGDNCRFNHSLDVTRKLEESAGDYPDDTAATEELTEEVTGQTEAHKISVGPVSVLLLKDLNEDTLKSHRDNDLLVIKRRFPKSQLNGNQVTLTFTPSDPDWPYSAQKMDLTLEVPEAYPKSAMMVTVQEDEVIPEKVCKLLQAYINDWLYERQSSLKSQGKVELVFRSFIRWLDHHAEELFTRALKQYQRECQALAAGLEFIPAAELKQKYKGSSDPSENKENEGEPETKDQSSELGEKQDVHVSLSGWDEKENVPTVNSVGQQVNSNVRRGTEVRLIGLQLVDSAVSLNVHQVTVEMICSRCNHHWEVDITPAKLIQAVCGRCRADLALQLRTELLHQHNAVLGYLDLDTCQPFDLLLMKSSFMIGCLNCDKEVGPQSLLAGGPRTTWCTSCNNKLTVAVDSVRFTNLQTVTIDTGTRGRGSKITVGQVIRPVKDPSIKEGQPLPNQGTCKHFQKSFRWFRFPCCGKAYPCDYCHEENEDHEMKMAARVICGFCAKEQPISTTRPCIGCHSDLTKRSTSHWEGGKGCRDTVKMSRDDDKKYANLNKTVPKKNTKK